MTDGQIFYWYYITCSNVAVRVEYVYSCVQYLQYTQNHYQVLKQKTKNKNYQIIFTCQQIIHVALVTIN